MFSTIPSLIARAFPGATGGGFDPDAQTYINAVIAGGGTLSSPQQNAINTYFLGLKEDGIFSKLYFQHLYLGGVANSNKINAINPGTYDLTFSGTWTHNQSGSTTAKSSSNYADTGYDAGAGYSTLDSTWSFGIIMANKDTSGPSYAYMGVSNPYMIIGTDSGKFDNFYPNNQSISSGNPLNYWNSVFRSGNTWYSGTKEGGSSLSSGISFAANITDAYTKPSSPTNIYINKVNTAGLESGGTYLMDWGGQYLTTTEANNLLLRINALLTVFLTNIFSDYDADAQTYINAVLSSGGSLSIPGQSAVNTLFVSIKNAGIYPKLKVMYPMIGGTQDSNKWNALNPVDSDAAYRLTYIGSNISFDANGINITGNNTAAKTWFTPSTVFANNAQTVGYYFTGVSSILSSNTFPYGGYTGVGTASEPFQAMEITGGNLTSVYYSRSNALSWGPVYNGMFTQACDDSNVYIRRNGNEIATSAVSVNAGRSNYPLYLGALNLINTNPPYQGTSPITMKFFYVADYLTPSEAYQMEEIINDFQTAFGRNDYVTPPLWVAAGSSTISSAVNSAGYSEVGTTWTASTSATALIPDQGPSSITFRNGVWYIGAGTASSTNKLIYSLNSGVNWTASSSANTLFGSLARVNALCTNGNILLAGLSGVSTTIGYSTDSGITWTSSSSASSIINDVYDICWDGSKFLAVGSKVGGSFGIMTSTDGITWSLVSFTSSTQLNGIAYNGSVYVAGGNAALYSSTDGTTWTARTPTGGFQSIFQKFRWNGTYWLGLGLGNSNGLVPVIYKSTNGTTWTAINSGERTLYAVYDASWNGSKWIAVGQMRTIPSATDAPMITSTDGDTWTSVRDAYTKFGAAQIGIFSNPNPSIYPPIS